MQPNIDQFVNENPSIVVKLLKENCQQHDFFKSKGFAYSRQKEPERWDISYIEEGSRRC